MALRNIRGKWYVDVRYQHQRYRKRSPLNSRGGAREFEAQLLQRLVRGEALTPTAPTNFADFSARWFETYVKANCKLSDQEAKERILRNHLLPRFGRLALNEIGNAQVEAFKRTLQSRGLRPQTINNILNTLSRCLRSAVEWEILGRLPFIKRVRVTQGPPNLLSPDERGQLLTAAAGEEPWHDMIVTALGTGLRLSELCALNWEHVDARRHILTVAQSYVCGQLDSPKSHRIRHIPLPGSVLTALTRGRRAGGPVFKLEGGRRVFQSRAGHALVRLCKVAGVRRVGWHTLRHTYASDLASRGVSMRAIQLLLGHASVTTTERYAHLTMTDLHSAVSTLDGPELTSVGRSWAAAPIASHRRAAGQTETSRRSFDNSATI